MNGATKVVTIGDKRVRYATKVWNNSLSNATTYGEELTINITFFCGGLELSFRCHQTNCKITHKYTSAWHVAGPPIYKVSHFVTANFSET